MQWHSKLLWNMQEKHIFAERVSWSCPYHVPTLTSKVSCNQRVFIAVNPGRIPLHMQSTCGRCVYVLLCATYVASISWMHTVVLLQGKCKSINVYRRAIYRRTRRWGKLIKKSSLSLATSPQGIHTLCLFSLLPFPRGSSWLSGHSLVTFGSLPSGRGYVHRRAMRGDKPFFFPFFPWPPLPLREAIYIYTHTLCLFFLLPFPWNLHDSLDILWQPLRKSDNPCGSLAIPSQVYEHKGLNMM